jgi:hypothetical protein
LFIVVEVLFEEPVVDGAVKRFHASSVSPGASYDAIKAFA